MAYYDEDGTITINEDAANADIRREGQASEILEQSLSALNSLISQAADCQGETATAIESKAREMVKRIKALMDALEDTQSYTRKVVKKYQKLDRELAQKMAADSAGR